MLHWNFKKHHTYLDFIFLTIGYVFYCLFWGLERLNTYTVLCFPFERAQERSCYLSISTLASKNISSTLFVLSLSLNMFFVPFPGILTSRCISDTYLVAVYTLNSWGTPYFFVYNCGKCNTYVSCCPFAFKTSILPFFSLRNL